MPNQLGPKPHLFFLILHKSNKKTKNKKENLVAGGQPIFVDVIYEDPVCTTSLSQEELP